MTDIHSGPEGKAGSWVHTIHLDQPSFEDNTADVDRLLRALGREGLPGMACDLEWIGEIPHMLRDSGFSLRCTLFSDGKCTALTEIAPASADQPSLGLAVDLGTTRYVLQTVDLGTGHVLNTMDRANPQGRIGPDILTRIHHAAQREGLRELQDILSLIHI